MNEDSCDVLTLALTIGNILTSGLNTIDIDYDILLFVDPENTRGLTITADIYLAQASTLFFLARTGQPFMLVFSSCRYSFNFTNKDVNKMKKTLFYISLISSLIIPSAFAFGYSQNNTCIEHIDKYYQDNSLLLYNCNIEDKDIKLINDFCEKHNVKELFLHENNISEIGAAELSQNKTVERLEISFNAIKDAGAIELAKNTRLTYLVVNSNQMSDKGIVALIRNRYLSYLGFGVDSFGLEVASEIANNTTLEGLGISGSILDESIIAELVKNTTLTDLSLKHVMLNMNILQEITKMTNLNYMFIMDTDIGDEGAKILASHSNFVGLWLINTNIGNKGIVELAGMSKLEFLDMDNGRSDQFNNHIGISGLNALIESHSLKSLSFGFNDINDEGATILAASNSIRFLVLGYNNVGNAGAIALSQNTILRSLDVSHNHIGASGKEALKSNTSIEKLYMGNNDGELKALQPPSILKHCKFNTRKFSTGSGFCNPSVIVSSKITSP